MSTRPRSSVEPPSRAIDYRATRERRHDYQIRLPAGWAPVRVPHDPPDGPIARCLGSFVTEADHEASVEVRCAKVDKELDPMDLLELHLEQGGATVVERIPAWSLGGQTGTLLVHRPIASGEAVTIARVEKDADLVYTVFAHTTVRGFAAREPALRDIVRSFRLLHPEGGLAEPLLPGGARFPMDHAFLYPASFEMSQDPTSDPAIAGYELTHKALGDRAGFLAVVAIARRESEHENAEEIAAWTHRALGKRGVDLGPLVLAEAEPLARELPTQVATGEGRYADMPVETELRVARHPEAWLVLARATTKRDAHGHAWLAHRRAFTIVRERFAAMPRPEA